MFNCLICNNTFKSSRGFSKHKSVCELNINKKFFCNFCDKELSSNNNLLNHQRSCKQKNSKTIQQLEEELASYKALQSDFNNLKVLLNNSNSELENERLKNSLLQAELENKNTTSVKQSSQIELFDKTIISLKADIKVLEVSLSNLERENKNLLKQLEETTKANQFQNNTINLLAKRSGNTYNNQINNINNVLQPITKDDYEKLCSELVDDHDIINEKQFARFCLKAGLKNKIIKTDHSRKVITYLDESGKQIKDPKAKELSENIFKSTKSVFEEKAKQYENFQDDQDQDRIDFYNNIVAVNKNAIAKFGDEIVKEANKSVQDNCNDIFKTLHERVEKSTCYIFSLGAFGIGEWIREQIEDKVTFCKSSISIKKKYIIISESNEKIENKILKDCLYYALNIDDFNDKISDQVAEYGETKKQIKDIVLSCKLNHKKLIKEKDESEWDNLIIGLIG